MADNPIQWTTHGAKTTPLNTELTGLTSGAYAVTADSVDNTGGNQFADFIFYVDGQELIAAGKYLSMYFIRSLDGTTAAYERGGTSSTTQLPARAADVIVPLAATSELQSVVIGPVALPNARYKLLVINNAGCALDATTTHLNKVICVPYNEKVVTA